MRIYKRILIPATSFFVCSCLLTILLPVSGANWQEVLAISGNVESIVLPPPSQSGTTLTATQTATGFVEDREGITVFGVRGEICAANGGEQPTEELVVFDTIQYKSGSGQFQNFRSEPVDISAKPVLEAGQNYCYHYEFTFTPIETEKVKYRNTVNVLILNHSGWLPGGNHCEGPDPCPFGPNPKADFTLPEATPDPVDPLSIDPVLTEVPKTELPPVTLPQETELPPTATLPSEPSPTVTPATEPTPSELPTLDPTAPPTDSPTPTSIELPPTESSTPALTEAPSESHIPDPEEPPLAETATN